MKLINRCFVLLILCGVIAKSHGTDLNCEFKDHVYHLGTSYTCVVTSLVNENNDIVIVGYSGVHHQHKNITDVEAIYIHETNTKYIPKNLGLVFNITSFDMMNTQLVEIKSEDFIGMEDLVELHFFKNKLTSLPLDVFSTLTKLRLISMSENQLEEIPNGVFSNNLQLEKIHLNDNKIKFLGSTLFSGLTELDLVSIKNNICIDKRYEGVITIIRLKNDIKSQCQNPDEIPPTTTQAPTEAPTSTTENPVELQLGEVKELNINLEKENLELKQNLLDSKTAHEKDRLDLETKIKRMEAENLELSERLTVSDAQNSTDMKFEDIKNMFINLERIGNETLLNGLKLNEKSEDKTINLNKQICKLEQENAELNTTLTTALNAQQLELTKLTQQRLEAIQETDRVKEELKEAQSQVNTITDEKNQCEAIKTIAINSYKTCSDQLGGERIVHTTQNTESSSTQ